MEWLKLLSDLTVWIVDTAADLGWWGIAPAILGAVLIFARPSRLGR